MNRNSRTKEYLPTGIARFYIWTIRRQEEISQKIRLQMWAAVSAVLLMSLVLQLKLETVLEWILYAGLFIGASLWLLIERRRSWLLRITDPRLKAIAHREMLAYLKKKSRSGSF